MIPKRIHYCWFGGSPLPDSAVKCVESWKRSCPGYEIVEWNEANFDVTCCDYVREAFESKKWAFVSDYARLKVMTEYGGIYMDTDVEVRKPLDCFLKERAFSGFETEDSVSTGIMACEKGFPLFLELLEEYEGRHFILPDGSLDLTTNVISITDACLKKGLKRDNSYQQLCGLALYPKDYFCPKNYLTGELECTERTYAIHHFSASWNNEKQKKWARWERRLIQAFGKKMMLWVMHRKSWMLIRHLYAFGMKETVKKVRRARRKGMEGKSMER